MAVVSKVYRIKKRPDGRWELRRDGAKKATKVCGTLLAAAARAVEIADTAPQCEIWIENDQVVR